MMIRGPELLGPEGFPFAPQRSLGDIFWEFRGTSDKLIADAKAGGTKAGEAAGTDFGSRFKAALMKGDFASFIKGGFGLGAGLAVFGAVTGALKGVADVIGDTIGAATEFQAALATINTVADLSDRELAALGEEVQALSIQMGKPSKELTDGLYDLVSAGISAEDAVGVLRDSAILATGALSTTGEAVDLLTTTINAWGLEASDSTHVMDVWAQAVAAGKVTAAELAGSIAQVAPIAAATGVSIEEVGAAYAVMTAQGVSASQVSTQLAAAITALLKPNVELLALQKELGGTTFEQMLASDGLAATLQALSDAAGGNTQAITKALGSTEAYRAMLMLTGANTETFTASLDDMNTAWKEGGVAMGQYEKRADTLENRQARH